MRRFVYLAIALGLAAAGVTGAAVAGPLDVFLPELGRFVSADKAGPIRHALGPSEPAPESLARAAAPSGRPDPLAPGIIESDVPVPVSPQLLRATNGWVAARGPTLVAVYAGAAGDDPEVGRFVIVRQDRDEGRQDQQVVDLAGSGPVRIAAAAGDRTLLFRTARGRAGELDLETGSAAP
jgi:hypothetical protein